MVLCTNPDSSSILAQSSHYNPQQFYFDDAAFLSWPNCVVANPNVRFSTSSCPPRHRYRVPESSTASSIPKRTASSVPTSPMPPKRTSEQSPTGTPAKLQKTDSKSENFSESVKKRLQHSTRTGQACDRCKIRKIRCDGLETGCSPCAQNHTECRTTDRITGIATKRGELNYLQRENDYMKDLLRRHGISTQLDTPTPNGYLNGASSHGMHQQWEDSPQPQPQANLYATAAPQNILPSNVYSELLSKTTQPGSIMDILSLLGMNIHDREMSPEEVQDATCYDRTYKSFLQTAHGISTKLEKVELPSEKDATQYVEVFFSMINPYLPILHKANFMTLLDKIYEDPSLLTSAETVMVHMVFAITMFQYAARTDPEQAMHLNTQSNLHYHYSLGKFYELSCSHTIQDVQAMAMICSHLRNFNKPDCAWMLSSHTMTLCKELGLHRQAKISDPQGTLSPYNIEIRKRVFWSVFTLNVGLSGKLGRPIPIRLDDFDIEMPEPMDDDNIDECGLPLEHRSGRCIHHIGIQNYKLYAHYCEMFMTIHAVRRHPETYVSTIANLTVKIQAWKDAWPPEVRDSRLVGNKVFPLYLELWHLEFQMLLRHPAVSMTLDHAYNAESIEICKDAARQILSIVRQLKSFQSLDTTWYNAAVFVVAMTTMLFSVWEKRQKTGRVTPEDVHGVRQEMNEWLGIMGDIGTLLGSGNRLRDTIRKSIEPMMTDLIQSVTAPKPPPAYLSSHPSYDNSDAYSSNHHSKSPLRGGASQPPSTPSTTAVYTPQSYSSFEPQPATSSASYNSTPYPAATQYYPPPANSATSGYGEATQYPSFPDPVDAPLLAAFAEQASQQAGISAPPTENEAWRGSYPSQAQNNHSHPQSAVAQMQHAANQNVNGVNGGGVGPVGTHAQYHSGSQGWHMFSTALAENMGSQDQVDSMSAAVLLELQQGSQKPVTSNASDEMAVSMAGGWPGIVMDLGPGQQ